MTERERERIKEKEEEMNTMHLSGKLFQIETQRLLSLEVTAACRERERGGWSEDDRDTLANSTFNISLGSELSGRKISSVENVHLSHETMRRAEGEVKRKGMAGK